MRSCLITIMVALKLLKLVSTNAKNGLELFEVIELQATFPNRLIGGRGRERLAVFLDVQLRQLERVWVGLR